MRDLDLSKLTRRILPAERGVERVIHVVAPALKERLDGGDSRPVIAVRSSLYGFKKAMLVRHVELLGPASVEERFLAPLPGTNGRGVVPLVTTHAIEVYFDGAKPTIVDVDDPPPERPPAPKRPTRSRRQSAHPPR